MGRTGSTRRSSTASAAARPVLDWFRNTSSFRPSRAVGSSVTVTMPSGLEGLAAEADAGGRLGLVDDLDQSRRPHEHHLAVGQVQGLALVHDAVHGGAGGDAVGRFGDQGHVDAAGGQFAQHVRRAVAERGVVLEAAGQQGRLESEQADAQLGACTAASVRLATSSRS